MSATSLSVAIVAGQWLVHLLVKEYAAPVLAATMNAPRMNGLQIDSILREQALSLAEKYLVLATDAMSSSAFAMNGTSSSIADVFGQRLVH